jgi:hypothetical protein
LEAEITLDYKETKVAEAVARAVSPDNFKTPKGMIVKTAWKDGKVFTKITCKDNLPTFIATIDDLLSCTLIAEKALQTTKRL